MGLFGPPDVAKLAARKDLKGLTKLLAARRPPALRAEAARALALLLATIPPEKQGAYVAPLVAALDDPAGEVVSGASQALGAIGAPAILPLTTGLRAPSERIRIGAANTLGRICAQLNEQAYLRLPVDGLVAALKDASAGVRQMAAWALGQLIPRLDASSRGLPVENLLLALRDQMPVVREAAVAALGASGEGRAIPPLVNLLHDPSEVVRKRSAAALQQLGWQPTNATEEGAYYVAHQQWDRVHEAGAGAAPALARILQDGTSELRQEAARLIGQSSSPQAIDALIQATADEDPQVRKAAETALEQAGNPETVDALLAALRSAGRENRPSLLRALGHSGAARAVPALIEALKSRNTETAAAAGDALQKIGGPSVTPLIHLLRDTDTQVRDTAARQLERLGTVAVPVLIEALANGGVPVNQQAATILGRLHEPRAYQALVNALNDDQRALAAAEALAGLGDLRAVPHLTDLLDHRNEAISKAAIASLVSLGDPRAIEPLIQQLKNRDAGLRQEAARALIRLYQRSGLDASHKSRILSQQDRIAEADVESDPASPFHHDQLRRLDSDDGMGFK